MNFFEQQDEARRNTTRLILLFMAAIAAIILAFYLVAILMLRTERLESLAWWQPDTFLLVSLITLSIIGFGSLTKLRELSRGGVAVAESLGGRKLDPQTDDVNEARLLNVVAEMALASGTPIPGVYLLDRESSINAFAAGYSPDDAVIGVTRGCIDQLTRDELQGVIGHEFSHILNGDMRLNLKLIGVLQGLLTIHILGRMLLRDGWANAPIRSKNEKSEGNGFIVIGLAMMAIGGIGLLFGRLIKSAVSRQREFLADASAVQFTRNPDGITDALRKIGGITNGSRIAAPRAEEASHLFFGEALPGMMFLGDWYATHPPLKERIRRLKGVALEEISTLTPVNQFQSIGHESPVLGFQGGTPIATAPPQAAPEAFMAAVGTLSPQNLASAQAFLKQLPPEIVAAIRQPEGAKALVCAILLDSKPEVRSHQLALLKAPESSALADQTAQLAALLQTIDSRQYLSLVDLAVPALRSLDLPQCTTFLSQVKALAQADKRLSVSEYVLQLILHKRLRPQLYKTVENPQQFAAIDPIWTDCLTILSILARLGHKTSQDATYAFKSGVYRLPDAKKRELPTDMPQVKLYDLGASLSRLELAVPKLKQAVVDACAHTALINNDVTAYEAELLRAIVITLDCPIPPFLEAIRYN
ncbi:MAG TPA: M48 family metallopeptidase [Leptolyngbyaceae cyanobacterium]